MIEQYTKNVIEAALLAAGRPLANAELEELFAAWADLMRPPYRPRSRRLPVNMTARHRAGADRQRLARAGAPRILQ